MFKLYLKGTL